MFALFTMFFLHCCCCFFLRNWLMCLPKSDVSDGEYSIYLVVFTLFLSGFSLVVAHVQLCLLLFCSRLKSFEYVSMLLHFYGQYYVVTFLACCWTVNAVVSQFSCALMQLVIAVPPGISMSVGKPYTWRFGVAVMRWSRSTQLLYIEPS